MLAEWVHRALTSGFCGAITQALGEIEPEWHGAIAATAVLPIASHAVEFLVHWLRRTPHLKTSVISSMSFTVISTLLQLSRYAAGRGCPSLLDDLRAMPRIITGFLTVLPMRIRRCPARLENTSPRQLLASVRFIERCSTLRIAKAT